MFGLIIFVLFGVAVLFVKEKYLVPTIIIFLVLIGFITFILEYESGINSSDHPVVESTSTRNI